MFIKSLRLKNFRNIEDKTFEFKAPFTVIIGKNGSGKSTVLHGLRIAAGAYTLGLGGVARRHISKDEIRMVQGELGGSLIEQRPVAIEAEGRLDGANERVTWTRKMREESYKTTSSNAHIGAIKNIAQSKYQAHQNPENSTALHLPVIAYFGTDRVHGSTRNRAKGDRRGRNILKEGYHNWDRMRSNTYQYKEWLATYQLLVDNGQEYVESMTVFEEALGKACPFIKKIVVNYGELWVDVAFGKEENKLGLAPIYMHSDGVATFVEMVAELAFRCIVLNGELKEEAVKHSLGVVIIDELDIHLHPSWQKHIVDDLQSAFPNIQFVVTTHSPFIVQSLKDEELINLEEEDDPEIGLTDDPQNYSLEEVVEGEMGVDGKRSEEFQKMMNLAEQYKLLVRQGKSSTTDEETALVKQQLDELEEQYSSDTAFVATLRMERISEGL
ncbi:MAG: AAA family ATPase [Aureispira sp.]